MDVQRISFNIGLCFALGYGFARRFSFDLRKALILQANSKKDMTEPVERHAGEEFVGEIQREATAIGGELLNHRFAIQRGNEADQFFDLIAGEHKRFPYALDPSYSPKLDDPLHNEVEHLSS